MRPTCANTWCKAPFEVGADDLAMLEKLSPEIGGKTHAIPPPDFCFQCRLQRRTAFYNARSLYKRTCSKSGKQIVSIYSPDKPHVVYDRDLWYEDHWNPMDYGRDVDFSRPFFDQFREFLQIVPLPSRSIIGMNQNSDYTNDVWKCKNCYLVFDGQEGEDCYYDQTFEIIRSCMDCLVMMNSELCYECIHCTQSYNVKYARFCVNCSDSWFLRDCIGCRNCFGCANLRQKQHCIFNKQKTPAEYAEFLRQFPSTKWSAVRDMRDRAEAFFLTHPVKAMRGEQNIDSIGDNIHQCKNAQYCFDCTGLQDCRYMTNCQRGAKDSGDVYIWGLGMELCYNGVVIGSSPQRVLCSYYVTESANDILYSAYCSRNSSRLFGCIGLRHKSNCIFNKQYSPEEYDALATKLIGHMRKTGEWGAFFPPETSCFGYNETMAQTYFPLSKEEVLKRGWQWSDYDVPVQAERTIPADKLPDSTDDIPDDILNWALVCEVSKKPFKIVKQELDFYRTQKLPIPRRHPDQRHLDRFAFKNSFKLWDRTCGKCGKPIKTADSPEKPEIVWCEECYLKEVY